MSVTSSNGHEAPPPEQDPKRTRRRRILRIVGVVISLGIVAGILVGIVPKFANYSSVWKTITGLTSMQLLVLIGVTRWWPRCPASRWPRPP